MATHQFIPAAKREQLHQEWMERSEQAFDRMFAEPQQADLITFTQREDRAMLLSADLAKWLVEEHLASDSAAQPSTVPSAEPCGTRPAVCCSKCGKAGDLVTAEADPLPGRTVLSRAGEVQLEREQYRCTTCRVVFFPLGPEIGTRHGGVQPAGSAETGASRGQGIEFPRRL